MKKFFSQKGFTLVEMLIVVAIIAILASVFLVGLRGFRGSAYDSRRLSDVQKVQSYIELYYNKYRSYPSADSWAGQQGSLESALSGASIGVSALPTDPGGQSYYYLNCLSGQGYVLAAPITWGSRTLEDSARPDTTGCVGMSLPTTCQGQIGTSDLGLYCVAQ